VDDAFRNSYEDSAYAADYAQLEWTGTYHLIRRELPGILRQHVAGRRALDFGCGTGRSTRLLRDFGFAVTGVDIARPMIERARQIDPGGQYVLLADGDLEALAAGSVDLILAAFPFDNIPASEKPGTFRALARLLAPAGRLISIVSTPELYTHEWVSFSTDRFPGNRTARNGDLVQSVITQFRNGKPADDVLCTDEGYREVYRRAGLEVESLYKPLGREKDGLAWISESAIAPWAIYVLRPLHPTTKPLKRSNAESRSCGPSVGRDGRRPGADAALGLLTDVPVLAVRHVPDVADVLRREAGSPI
jgi:SAM-dependent methyltransferase